MTADEYSYIEFMLNCRDLAALRRFNPGDTIEVHTGAFTVYPTELGLACENVTDDEVVVGELHHVAVVPVPTTETMFAGGISIGDPDIAFFKRVAKPNVQP